MCSKIKTLYEIAPEFLLKKMPIAEVFYDANYPLTIITSKKYVKESQFLLFSRQKVYKNANSLET